MLTAEEIDAAGEEGVTETPPKLTQFKEQVDGFEAIYDEVESLKVFIYIYIYIILYIYVIYMLGTDVKPQARFKAVRTVLKPSGPLYSRRDGFKTVVARFTRFRAVQPDGFASVCGACVAPWVRG